MTEISKEATSEWPKAMMEAVVSCPHSIDADEVRLLFDPKAAGHNALNQLSRRVSAVLSTLPIAGEGKVKALEWRDVALDHMPAYSRGGLVVGLSPSAVGTYQIVKDGGGRFTVWLNVDELPGVHVDKLAAKAAAQADYEARILSALTSSHGKDGGHVDSILDVEMTDGWTIRSLLELAADGMHGVDFTPEQRLSHALNSAQVDTVPGKDGGQEVEERDKPMSLVVALDFADNPRPYHTLQSPADTNSELYEALRVIAEAYRAPSPQSASDADAVIERLTKALRSADEWMSCVEAHLQSGEPFKRDRDAMRSALAALAESPSSDREASEGWQPIETAPKKGEDFIAWDGKYAFRCSAGKYYVKYPHEEGGPTYRDAWNGIYYDSIVPEKPILWQPLPAPSKIAEAKGSGE